MKIRNWAKNIPKWEKAVAQEVDKETAEVILATEAMYIDLFLNPTLH